MIAATLLLILLGPLLAVAPAVLFAAPQWPVPSSAARTARAQRRAFWTACPRTVVA
jgi:hypothetical protein